jgi:small GTP-binding protein
MCKICFLNLEMTTSLKLVCVGDAGVGKTCFLKRLNDDIFEECYHSTESRYTTWVEIDYQGKKYLTMDTAGQEKGLKPPFGWNEADVFFVMFDLTNSLSYKNTSWWIEKIRKNNLTARLILVGTKCESKSRKLHLKDIQVHNKYSIPYVEISSKNKISINELFTFL